MSSRVKWFPATLVIVKCPKLCTRVKGSPDQSGCNISVGTVGHRSASQLVSQSISQSVIQLNRRQKRFSNEDKFFPATPIKHKRRPLWTNAHKYTHTHTKSGRKTNIIERAEKRTLLSLANNQSALFSEFIWPRPSLTLLWFSTRNLPLQKLFPRGPEKRIRILCVHVLCMHCCSHLPSNFKVSRSEEFGGESRREPKPDSSTSFSFSFACRLRRHHLYTTKPLPPIWHSVEVCKRLLSFSILLQIDSSVFRQLFFLVRTEWS